MTGFLSASVFCFCTIAFSSIHCYWWDDYSNKGRVFHLENLASAKDHFYMVSVVLIRWINGRSYEELRGGGCWVRLIGDEYIVLTAGSTLKYFEANNIQPQDVRIRAHSEYWDECNCGISKEYEVIKWLIHPEYYEHTFPFIATFSYHDIGLIAVLNRSINMRYYVSLENPNVPLEKLQPVAVGWGWLKGTERVHRELRQIPNLRIMSHKECQQQYNISYLPENTFCVKSGMKGGTIPCPFDQGGPLVWKFWNQVYVIGIISTTPKCGDPNYPPIITNSSRYIDFIWNRSWLKKQ